MSFAGKARHVHFVGGELHGLREIERRTFGIRRDRGLALTEKHLLVRETASLAPEDEGYVSFGEALEPVAGLSAGLAQGRHRRSELAVVARQRPGESHAFERLGQSRVRAAGFKDVDGTRREGDRLLVRTKAGFAGRHDAQVAKSHGLDGARRRSDVPRMTWLAQNEAHAPRLSWCLHGNPAQKF